MSAGLCVPFRLLIFIRRDDLGGIGLLLKKHCTTPTSIKLP